MKQLICSCGSKTFFRFFPARGAWQQGLTSQPDGTMRLDEIFTDGIQYGRQPKTIKCSDCGRRHPNPDWTP